VSKGHYQTQHDTAVFISISHLYTLTEFMVLVPIKVRVTNSLTTSSGSCRAIYCIGSSPVPSIVSCVASRHWTAWRKLYMGYSLDGQGFCRCQKHLSRVVDSANISCLVLKVANMFYFHTYAFRTCSNAFRDCLKCVTTVLP
jgi:hypothetical protein